VAASTERTAATGRGFQDTGNTAKAFEGEEVDWYVCNVASYHVKQSVDPSLALAENEDLKRMLLLDDETIVRAAAVAVGTAELEVLMAHYSATEEWVDAAKVSRAIGTMSAAKSQRVEHGMTALALLEQAGSETIAAQQLELDIRGSLVYVMHTGPEKKQMAACMQALMLTNKSLRVEPLGLYYATVYPRLYAYFGMHPKLWDAGKIATQDTIREGFRLQIHEGMALYTKAVEESVGARKECIRIGYELIAGCVLFMPFRSTDQTAKMHQQLLETKWGGDGAILVAACMDYHFDRHFMISQGIGARMDCYLVSYGHAQSIAEYCGNVQQMVQLFNKQQGDMQEFVKRGVPGIELPFYCHFAAPCYTGLDLNALHPFGKSVVALFASCEGRCTNPSDCEEWYESADFSAWVQKNSRGHSSKDGLHHAVLKPVVVHTIQAVLSLSLASIGASSFDLSWLDSLPAPDDPKMHDCSSAASASADLRVLTAEVLEWQGRHKEAIRCVDTHSSALRIQSAR
jgi:hypothetical protein